MSSRIEDSLSARVDYVSTGALPASAAVREVVNAAYERYRTNNAGQLSHVYPRLAAVPAGLFGISVAGVDGSLYEAGDADYEFAIMSVAKPFVFAIVCQAIGPGRARERVGVNATGRPFDSVSALEASVDGRTNPMVNAGAIATTSLVAGATVEAKWDVIRDGLSRFAGRELALNQDVYASAAETNHRNRAIALLLHGSHRLYSDPGEAVELYTRQSSLNVTAHDLAVMGATLADGGVNPLTRARVVDEEVCRHVLAVMTTAGLYETSGDWLYDVGLPGKSGIGGGIVTVSPGKAGLGTFAPLLDRAGNSVRGQQAAAFLSRRLGMDLFASKPV